MRGIRALGATNALGPLLDVVKHGKDGRVDCGSARRGISGLKAMHIGLTLGEGRTPRDLIDEGRRLAWSCTAPPDKVVARSVA